MPGASPCIKFVISDIPIVGHFTLLSKLPQINYSSLIFACRQAGLSRQEIDRHHNIYCPDNYFAAFYSEAIGVSWWTWYITNSWISDSCPQIIPVQCCPSLNRITQPTLRLQILQLFSRQTLKFLIQYLTRSAWKKSNFFECYCIFVIVFVAF